MARTRQTARSLYHRGMKIKKKVKKVPEFQNFIFSPKIRPQLKQNYPITKNFNSPCKFYDINYDLSIYSLMKKCFQNIPKDFRLITSANVEYSINKIIIFHTSNRIKNMIEENPDLSFFKLQTNDCDNFISKFSSMLNGNSEIITKEDIKIAKKIAKELQIDGFPLWMKPHKQRSTTFNYQNQFNRKPPKFSVICISPSSFISFLRYQKRKEYCTINTQSNIYKVPLFGAFCSSLIFDQYKNNIKPLNINNYLNNFKNNENKNNNDNDNGNDGNSNHVEDDDDDEPNDANEIFSFTYDFEDTNKEFENLANYMSGNFYNLVADNMEISLKFANDLGINELHDSIHKIIDEYNKRNKLIQENVHIFDDDNYLASQIYRFQECKQDLVEEVFHSLLNSVWCRDSEHVKEMVYNIIRIASTNYKIIDQVSQLFALLDQAKIEREPLNVLFPTLIRILFNNTESVINQMNPSFYSNNTQSTRINSQIILHLKKYKLLTSKDIVFMIGGISIPNNLSNCKNFSIDRDNGMDQSNSNYSNQLNDVNIRPIHYFFSPEIEEVFPNCLPENCIISEGQRTIEGEKGTLMNAIYNDDIERFKEIESSSNDFEYNQTIFFPNNFEFIELTLVEYAAEVDSPKVFNYLISKFDQKVPETIDPNTEHFSTEFLRNVNAKVLLYSIGKSRSIINSIIPHIDSIIKERELQKQEINIITPSFPFNNLGNDPQITDSIEKSRSLTDYIEAAIIKHDNDMLEYFAKKSNQYLLCHSLSMAIECNNIDAFIYLSKQIPILHTKERLSLVGYVAAAHNNVNMFIFLSKIFDIDMLIGAYTNFQLPNHMMPNELSCLDGVIQSSSIRIFQYILENCQRVKSFPLGRIISDAAKYDKLEFVEYCFKNLKNILLPKDIINIVSYFYMYREPEIAKIVLENCQIPDQDIFHFIEVAAASNDIELVSKLIEKQLKIDPKTTFASAFNAAAKYGNLEICQYIASLQSDITNGSKDQNNKENQTNNDNNENQNNNNNDNQNNDNNGGGYNFEDSSDEDDNVNNNDDENELKVYNPVSNLSSVDYKQAIVTIIRSTVCYSEHSNKYHDRYFYSTSTAIEIMRLYLSILQGEDFKSSVIRGLHESVCIGNNEIALFLLTYKIADKASFVLAARNGMFEVVKKLIELDCSDSFVNHVHSFYGTAINASIDVGCTEIFDYLISLPNIDLNLKDSYQMSPLVTSSFNRRYEMFIKIIKTGKFIKEDLNKALLYYCRDTKNIQPFISPSSPTYFSLMLSASMSKEDIQIQKAQTAFQLVNSQVSDSQLRTVFPDMVFERLRGSTSYYIRPTNIGLFKNEEEDKRFINFYFGSQEKVDALIDSNEIENCRKLLDFTFYYADETFLITACKFGRLELVKLLLQQPKTNVNVYDNKGNTPLIHATAQGHFEIVRLLCESKADEININQTNFFKRTAFSFAACINRIDILKYLASQKGFNADKSQACTAVASSLINGYKSITNLLLKGEENQNQNDNDSKLFIDFDINKEIIFNHLFGISDPLFKQSVLQMPAFNNFNKNVGIPAQRNRVIENNSWTLLCVAVQREDVESLTIIANHPRFNMNESNADRALFYATKSNNLSVFIKMLEISNRDVNFNYKGKESRSLLCTAISNKANKIIKYIINHPQFDPVKSHSNIAFFAALLSQPYEIIEICSKMKGIDFNGLCPKLPPELVTTYGQLYNKNIEGMTPLYIAATISPEVLELLLKIPNSNIDINCRNSDGSTPIFGAIQVHMSLELLLKQKGVDVNAQDNNGRTILMCMVMQRFPQCAPMILARDDVDLSICDKEGKNALTYANPDMADVDPKSISWKEAAEIFLQSAYSQQEFY